MFVNTADIYLYQWGGILMLSKLKYLVKGLHNVLYGQRMKLKVQVSAVMSIYLLSSSALIESMCDRCLIAKG